MSSDAEVDSALQTTDADKVSSLLVRTPWRPPVGVSAEGIYITLDDGRRLIDAVGGAAVACIGGNHPVVMQAIKDQVDKVSCVLPSLNIIYHQIDTFVQMFIVCSCQISPPRPWHRN
jgi:4-aminobutyrate aminotransferase-like enzyme